MVTYRRGEGTHTPQFLQFGLFADSVMCSFALTVLFFHRGLIHYNSLFSPSVSFSHLDICSIFVMTLDLLSDVTLGSIAPVANFFDH